MPPLAESRPFVACDSEFVRRATLRELAFLHLPREAEADICSALDCVPSRSQAMLIQAAEDRRVPDAIAMDRLSCLWVTAAAVNLADDLADGDCDYLEPRVAPGISYLLQSFADIFAARGEVSSAGLQAYSMAMARAAAGQSLEVRTSSWNAERYLAVAELIAGQQYAAYFRLLWDGTAGEKESAAIGLAVGTVGILLTDLHSADHRFTSMSTVDQELVIARGREAVGSLSRHELPSLRGFSELAVTALEAHAGGGRPTLRSS